MKKALNPILFFAISILFFQTTFGQSTTRSSDINIFRIAFYNVENLFDTLDDPITDDSDFLPGSRIPWTSERYEVKLSHLADVIKALSTPKPVAVMGLCEVENITVLEELVSSPGLIPYRFKIIHRESPDERGIDNALIYDAAQFQPVAVRSIPIKFETDESDHTRDILYVKGLDPKLKSDTLHIFVNHWPSRSGGQEISEPKRIKAAETLKIVTDSILTRNPKSLIVIIGDFNDEPSDKSLVSGLKAEPPAGSPSLANLYNLMDPLYRQGKGTLWYKDWDLFDQVILSGYFWNKEKGIMLTDKEGKIFDPDWLMYKPAEGSPRPNRTAAKDYYGGYSDHLPVYIDLILKR
jgi:hypothetical protein